jgi:hypothetical protein
MNQTAQVELAGVLRGGELNAQLLIGFIEDRLVVAFAAAQFMSSVLYIRCSKRCCSDRSCPGANA